MHPIVFCAFVASILAVAQQATVQRWIAAEKDCVAKYSAEAKEILDDLKFKRTLPENPPDDFKCLIDCIGRAVDVIDEQGNFHAENMKSLTTEAFAGRSVTPEEIHQAVEECSKVDHEVACEKTHMYLQCKHDKFKHLDLHDDIKQSTADAK